MSHQPDYYQSIFKGAPAMVLLCNARGIIFSASDLLCQTLQADCERLLGDSCSTAFNVDDAAGLQAAIEAGVAYELPLNITLADGTQIEVELNCSMNTGEPLEGLRMLAFNDVTERNQAIRTAEDYGQQLVKAKDNLQQFTFVATHDLQEPLRKIQQFSSFLEEELQEGLSEDGKYFLNVVTDASNRMSSLLSDLQKYASMSQRETQVLSVSLDLMLKSVLLDMDGAIKDASATINVGPLPQVEADKSMLRELISALVANSIKYRSPERPVVVSIESDGNSFRVTDNGIGFDMQHVSKMFEPFGRLHRQKEYKGNGIGLAIAAAVCTQHNWQLSAQSEPGVGSTFTVTFRE